MLEARAGQRVIVHFTNALPTSTTIHWHGIRLAARMDGTSLAQTEVGPNESFTYDFVVPDAGFFWYHPHVDAEHQIERSLYAPLLVRGDPEIPVTRERVLVLDDVKIGSDGTLVEDTLQMDLMMGRQGNVLLVNGARSLVLEVAPASRARWRLVNSANGTFFNLALPGGARFLVIGWDGGMLAEPYESDTLLVSPGER